MRVFFGTSDEFEVGALESVYEAARRDERRGRPTRRPRCSRPGSARPAGSPTTSRLPPIGGTPALIDFVNETKRGYCQHYAGAMALMLRLLGVPARVAVGFTSGEYSSDDKEWVVKDTNAHAWVEVWFPEFGGSPSTRPRAAASSTPHTPSPPRVQRRRRRRDRLRRPPREHLADACAADPLGRQSGLEDAALGGGTSGTLTVVRERGLGIFTLLALVIGGAIAAVSS